MKRTTFLFTFLLLAFSTHAQMVKTSGAARNVMMGIDLSSTIWLDSLLTSPHLIALGPIEDLQGEITALNGEVWTSTVQKEKILVEQRSDVRAPFLVYAHVPEWKSYTASAQLQNLSDLESFIDSLGRAHGFDKDDAFALRIIAHWQQVDYHIIMRDVNEKEHSHEAHNKAKRKYTLNDSRGELVGFFSRQHEGVFTHRGQYIHVHFLPEDRQTSGHLDGVKHTGNVEVLLPILE